jgi:hypothetical protein
MIRGHGESVVFRSSLDTDDEEPLTGTERLPYALMVLLEPT